MRRRPARRRTGPLVLAGWLFADFLLVLALVAMGGQSDPLAVGPAPNHSPSPSPSPSHTAAPKPKGPRSVSRTRFVFDVHGTSTASLTAQIRKATARRAGRQAALVLTFGGTEQGDRYATTVNKVLHKGRPSMFGPETLTENFLKINRPADTAELWVYFYTSTR